MSDENKRLNPEELDKVSGGLIQQVYDKQGGTYYRVLDDNGKRVFAITQSLAEARRKAEAMNVSTKIETIMED